MTLFFHSHICNDICKSLGLTQFDIAPSELKLHEGKVKCLKTASVTMSKGNEEPLKKHYMSARARYLQQRMASNDSNELIAELDESEGYSTSPNPSIYLKSTSLSTGISMDNSHTDYSNDDSFDYIKMPTLKKPRPSAVFDEKVAILNGNTEFSRRNIEIIDTYESILGSIHLELCNYHENGRFLVDVNDKIDYEAALFHLIKV